MLKDCECRQVVMKEPEADAVVLGELKRKLKRVLDEEELRLERRADAPAAGSRGESLRNALEAAKKAKQRLFEKLADREIGREVFLERKKGYDEEIARLEREISDVGLVERIDRDADGEARERADVARSFLDVEEMTEEIWERFVKGARVYPDGRIEVRWNFGDEMGGLLNGMMWRMKKWFMKKGYERVSGEISGRQGKRKVYIRFSGGF